MSKSKYRWWGYARNVVRAYPKLMDAVHLTADDRRDRDAVTTAIDIIRRKRKGEDILALIEDVYWGNALRLEDSALRLYISNQTAIRWHGEFIRTVGNCLGFSTEDGSAEFSHERGAP